MRNQNYKSMHYFDSYCRHLNDALSRSEFSNGQRERLGVEEGLTEMCEITHRTKEKGGRILFCGNGASAAFASHMALDWTKNGGIPALSFNDASLQTALVNDLGPDMLFSSPVEWHGKAHDLLVAISSSGNSPNIVNAIKSGRRKGMSIVTLSGLQPDNLTRSMGCLNLYVPAKTYGMVESAHQVLLHMWLDCYMGISEWSRDAYQNMRADDFRL